MDRKMRREIEERLSDYVTRVPFIERWPGEARELHELWCAHRKALGR